MNTSRERLDYLVWSVKDKINKVFDVKDATIEEMHVAVQEMRGFLEARAAQSATPFEPPGSEVPYAPKAPPALPELSDEMRALLGL